MEIHARFCEALQHETASAGLQPCRRRGAHGELQLTTALLGIRHSEYDASPSEPVHLPQTWIQSNHVGVDPGCQRPLQPADATSCMSIGPRGAGRAI